MSDLSWGPPRWRRLAYAGLALASLLLAWRTRNAEDPLSPLAVLVVAVVFGALAALDLWFGIALTAQAAGLRISRGGGRVELVPWSELDRIEAAVGTRHLVQVAGLELDVGDRLILLSRHRLGTDPVLVAAALTSVRPSGPR